MDDKDAGDDGYIVEFIRVGNSMKVVAIDQATGREVSMVGDPKATRAQLSRLAIEKLRYVQKKESGN